MSGGRPRLGARGLEGEVGPHHRARQGWGRRRRRRFERGKDLGRLRHRYGGIFQIMSTVVSVNTYTQSVTYVTDKLLTSIKNIIRLSGLNPTKLVSDWGALERGIKK